MHVVSDLFHRMEEELEESGPSSEHEEDESSENDAHFSGVQDVKSTYHSTANQATENEFM